MQGKSFVLPAFLLIGPAVFEISRFFEPAETLEIFEPLFLSLLR